MTDYFVYSDETGSLDYSTSAGPRFAVGTATFKGDHSAAMWSGFTLRTSLEAAGVKLPKGFHAVDDSRHTRDAVFSAIDAHPPDRVDYTYFTKANAYDHVRERGKPHLYKLALYQHLKYVIPLIAGPGDRVFAIAATIHLNKNTLTAAREALDDVCDQLSGDGREVSASLWESRSSWGLQVADYCTWAVQRDFEGKACPWYPAVVRPLVKSRYGPWN